MINYVELVLGLVLAIAIAGLLFLITGIIRNKDGYVSIIEKKHVFYKIEIRKHSWYAPLVYRKAAYYPTNEAKVKCKGKTITYKINDVMALYKAHIKIKDLVEDTQNLEADFAKYNISLISIE